MAEKNDSDFVKEAIRLPDGRELIYYNFSEVMLPEKSSSEKQSKASKE